MNDVAKFLVASIEAQTGISEGTLRIVGSVVRHASGPMKGKIHSYLQETGAWNDTAAALLNSDPSRGLLKALKTTAKVGGATGNPLVGVAAGVGDLALQGAAVVQTEVVRRGVNRIEEGVGRVENTLTDLSFKIDGVAQGFSSLQSLGVANLGLSAVGVGVSLAGFALTLAKLERVQKSVHELSEKIDMVNDKLDQLRQERVDRDFLDVQSLLRRFDEAWQMGRQENATQEWLAVGREARRYQDRFNENAHKLLFALPPSFDLADTMIDALTLTGGLRVASFMAANEGQLAKQVAKENAQQVELLTGAIGLADLVSVQLPEGIDPGSQDWSLELSRASEEARPKVQKLRQREAAVATRAAPLSLLEQRGITPHGWLEAARGEVGEPVILLRGDAD
jgi:hypothetical protein